MRPLLSMDGALGKASRWPGPRAKAVSSRKLKHQKDSCSLQEQKRSRQEKRGQQDKPKKGCDTVRCALYILWTLHVGLDICCKRRDQESAGRVRLPGAAVFVSFRFHNHKARRVHPAASCAGLLFHLGSDDSSTAERKRPQRWRNRVGDSASLSLHTDPVAELERPNMATAGRKCNSSRGLPTRAFSGMAFGCHLNAAAAGLAIREWSAVAIESDCIAVAAPLRCGVDCGGRACNHPSNKPWSVGLSRLTLSALSAD